jgi:hypothetical protein
LDDVGINGWVLAFTLGVGVITGTITGLIPALQASRGETASTLRAGGQTIAGNRAQQRLRSGLVAAEVALSLMLLIGSGLLIRSFGQLMGAERGFSTENRLVASVNVPDTYGDEEAEEFRRQLLDRVRALPPVLSASAVHIRPLAGGSTGLGFVRPDEPEPEGGIPWASWRLVTPGYFQTIGLNVLKGRDFTDADLAFSGEGPVPTIVYQEVCSKRFPVESKSALRLGLSFTCRVLGRFATDSSTDVSLELHGPVAPIARTIHCRPPHRDPTWIRSMADSRRIRRAAPVVEGPTYFGAIRIAPSIRMVSAFI